jgi:hypothetical protein
MDSPATPQDVAARWRSLTDDEELKAATLLDDAWQLIQVRNTTVATRLSAVPPTLNVAVVVMVQCAMVIRVLRNPDGKRQEQIEDYSYQRDDSPSGELFISDEELALIDVDTLTSTAFTIRPWHDPAVVLETPWSSWS